MEPQETGTEPAGALEQVLPPPGMGRALGPGSGDQGQAQLTPKPIIQGYCSIFALFSLKQGASNLVHDTFAFFKSTYFFSNQKIRLLKNPSNVIFWLHVIQ